MQWDFRPIVKRDSKMTKIKGNFNKKDERRTESKFIILRGTYKNP